VCTRQAQEQRLSVVAPRGSSITQLQSIMFQMTRYDMAVNRLGTGVKRGVCRSWMQNLTPVYALIPHPSCLYLTSRGALYLERSEYMAHTQGEHSQMTHTSSAPSFCAGKKHRHDACCMIPLSEYVFVAQWVSMSRCIHCWH
jgi:hypothetical protein